MLQPGVIYSTISPAPIGTVESRSAESRRTRKRNFARLAPAKFGWSKDRTRPLRDHGRSAQRSSCTSGTIEGGSRWCSSRRAWRRGFQIDAALEAAAAPLAVAGRRDRRRRDPVFSLARYSVEK